MNRKKKNKFVVLYGFNVKNKEETGYLKVLSDRCTVVKDRSDATRFHIGAKSGKGTPKDWCEFFRDEPNVSDWRFHPVIFT